MDTSSIGAQGTKTAAKAPALPRLDASAGRAKAEQSGLSRQRIRTAWLFLTPMMIGLAFVAGWPLLRTIYLGFTDATLSNIDSYSFVGFENYLVYDNGHWYGLLADSLWWKSVWNTLYITLFSVSIETVLGVLVALILHAKFPGRGLVRAAILIPWAIPTVVSAKMWGWMLHDQFGVINDLFMTLHIISEPIAWTVNPDTVLGTIVAVDVWKTTPFMALLTLAALQMLPKDCYEAARVDGIHPIRVFFKVTLPLIKPALVVAVVFRLLDALRIFDLVYILTSNSEDTIVMSVYARQALIDFQQIGYGSAASTLLFLMVFGLTLLYIFATRLKLDGSGDH
ncbi:carbohydrate ABC transporter permease [Marinobacterium sedimentorum]|uniref:carbohydrate ABC transporter permease n=1 Tax=Marinobacterium sedimentorum TaxID=2927804 RepID=UPI0020C5FEF3|nr:sugar ABC transporter permease [Marinobacterium sedimentorum]MCP8690192.1 sugar ABC transporter permease [Marinobacterium sedimentorum]